MIKRDLVVEMGWFGWLCGLLEGEGTFVPGSPAKPRRPCAALSMTDQDIVQRVCDLWGTNLYIHIPKNTRHKIVFRTELVGGSAVALMTLLRPHMSLRRQAQIEQAIVSFQPLRVIRHKRFQLLPEGAEAFDRYWLAGLFEGEASFGLNGTARLNPSPMLELNTVDHDVALRTQGILRERYAIAIQLHTRPPRRPGYQPQFHLACYGAAARAVMADIEPLMGERRGGRIAELIGTYLQPRLIREAASCYDVRGAA